MAKKKVINLSEQNISYTEDERHIRIISFNPNTMLVEVSISEEGQKKKVDKLPFAHLPKEIKKTVRPI
jgi:hypothetical protein